MKSQSERGFDFGDLFIFELANNHQGSVEHGKRVIREIAAVAKRAGVKGAFKLQFRELETFIHPDYRESRENKHIPRFLSTRLPSIQFAELVGEIRSQGMIPIATPFDELSVDLLVDLGIDIVKVGSCSAQDWPLLEKVADAGKPVICSTGGLTVKEIDKVVSFFQHRGVQFALMHCVAIYPTPGPQLHLNQIEVMRDRYPGVTIGFSTHEHPSNLTAVGLAYAKGARIFEKHVGVPMGDIELNAYSASPPQVAAWLEAYREAVKSCGDNGQRPIPEQEISDLRSLMRGVYAKEDIKAGTVLHRSDVFFAIPLQEGQLSSGAWKEGLKVDRDCPAGQPLSASLHVSKPGKKEIIYSAIHEIKAMLNNARIPLGHDFAVELSHHFGVERFHEIGCTIIECINRPYAKKVIVQMPGQWNPVHYHKIKDETFQVLSGTLNVDIENKKKVLEPGDSLWVPRGVWHAFGTETGVIFEEISTAILNDDSFYIDRAISSLPRDQRKTYLLNWGRHQFDQLEDRDGDDQDS